MAQSPYRVIGRTLVFSLLFGVTMMQTSHGLPEIGKDSIILDDEMSVALEEWFKLFYKASAHLRKSQLPKIYVVSNPEANAGTGAGGQYVFFSGLLIYCEDVTEFLGVVAHEISHTIGGHPIQGEFADQKSMASAVLTIIAGGLAAAAGKDMSILIAGLSGGVQAYAGNKMRHSIMNEFAADAEALKILKQAGIPRTGLLTFLKKLQKIYGTAEADSYFRTHPLTSERLERIADDIKRNPDLPWAQYETAQRQFERLKAKVLGFTLPPQKVLTLFTKDTPSHKLARAIALARMGKLDESLNLLKGISDNDPFILELIAQVYTDKQNEAEAINYLEKAIRLNPKTPLLKLSLAHLYTETKSHAEKAIPLLETVIASRRDDIFAWYLLGAAYAKCGKKGWCSWAQAEHAMLKKDLPMARQKIKDAEANAGTDQKLLLKVKDFKMALKMEKA